LEEILDDASSIARRIHLFAGSAGNSEHRLGLIGTPFPDAL